MNKMLVAIGTLLFSLVPAMKINAQNVKSQQPQWRPYVSIGGTYGERFNITNIDSEKDMNLNSSGYNIRAGLVSTYLAIEMEYASLQNFKAEYTYADGGITKSQTEFRLNALMFNLKVGYPLVVKKQMIKPYIIAGLGMATIDNKLSFSIASTYINGDYGFEHKSSGNNCNKVGFGLEIPVYKNKLVIFSEISRWHLNKKGGTVSNGKGTTAEFYDLKLSMITTVLNLKYLF